MGFIFRAPIAPPPYFWGKGAKRREKGEQERRRRREGEGEKEKEMGWCTGVGGVEEIRDAVFAELDG